MKARISAAVVVALALAMLQGCTTRIGDFTLLSTKNVEVGGKYKKLDGRYTGTDMRSVLLGIPLGDPSLKAAVDECIDAGRGELLTNAVLTSSYWSVILYGEMTIEVTADVWVRASISDLTNPSVELYELQGGYRGYELVSVLDPAKTIRVEHLFARM